MPRFYEQNQKKVSPDLKERVEVEKKKKRRPVEDHTTEGRELEM